MGYTIIYINKELFEIAEEHKANWYSEVCVIVNNGLEQGYDILIEGSENENR